MPGIIVIDGPDGAGKTTLAKSICEKFDGVYLHLTYRWKTRMFYYHTAAIQQAAKHASRGRTVVIDRWWPSEAVYADVFRGGSPWPLLGRFLERVMLKYAGVYVLAVPQEPAKALERFNRLKTEREEMYEDMAQVISSYNNLYYGLMPVEGEDYVSFLVKYGGMMQQKNVHLPYAVEREGLTEATIRGYIEGLAARLSQLRSTQLHEALFTDTVNFLGHLNSARWMIVGEERNENKSPRPGYPFFDYADSSLYLTQALHSLPIREEHVLYLNAYNNGKPEELIPDIINMRPYIRVVALGEKASQVLRRFGIDHWSMYHPAYHKRFKSDVIDYANMLRSAML